MGLWNPEKRPCGRLSIQYITYIPLVKERVSGRERGNRSRKNTLRNTLPDTLMNKEFDKYKCLNCGWRTTRVHRGHYPSIPCKRCGSVAHLQFDLPAVAESSHSATYHRTPMTEQQKRLLGFYRNEREWHRDIESRRQAPDGSIVRVPLGKSAPWE